MLPQNFVSYQLPEEEVERPLGSTKQLAFSRNVVVLEITGPNVTDLTLVDLPGIIQSVGHGEDKNNIQLVENLVKSYISKDCLILLVITMKGLSADEAKGLRNQMISRIRKPSCLQTKPTLLTSEPLAFLPKWIPCEGENSLSGSRSSRTRLNRSCTGIM